MLLVVLQDLLPADPSRSSECRQGPHRRQRPAIIWRSDYDKQWGVLVTILADMQASGRSREHFMPANKHLLVKIHEKQVRHHAQGWGSCHAVEGLQTWTPS